MSRGHGSAQRFILSFLDDNPGEWWSAWELAEARWDRKPTRNEVQTMRNAIRRLDGEPGVVVTELEPYWGVIGQLQDGDGRLRSKRVFPTLVIGRGVPERKLIEKQTIKIADQPSF